MVSKTGWVNNDGKSQTEAKKTEATRPLTRKDRIEIFRIATSSFVNRYGHQFKSGMTDEELAEALQISLGIFGGSGGPGRLSVTFAGAGLRIWGGWHVVNHVTEKPLFAGMTTIKVARGVYDIGDPDDKQLDLC